MTLSYPAARGVLPVGVQKVTSYQGAVGETTRVLSLSLTNTCDRFGAGAKGGPQVVNNQGEIVTCVTFTNRIKQILTGAP